MSDKDERKEAKATGKDTGEEKLADQIEDRTKDKVETSDDTLNDEEFDNLQEELNASNKEKGREQKTVEEATEEVENIAEEDKENSGGGVLDFVFTAAPLGQSGDELYLDPTTGEYTDSQFIHLEDGSVMFVPKEDPTNPVVEAVVGGLIGEGAGAVIGKAFIAPIKEVLSTTVEEAVEGVIKEGVELNTQKALDYNGEVTKKIDFKETDNVANSIKNNNETEIIYVGPEGKASTTLYEYDLYKDTEQAVYDKLEGMSKTQRSKYSVVIGGYDVKTGKIEVGFSGNIPENISKPLVLKSEALGGIGNGNTGLTKYNEVGNCAEFDVANKLLNGGSFLEDIKFTDALRPRNPEKKIETCENCIKIFFD